MKKLLTPLFLIAAASIAYAGGSCCDAGGDKSDKNDGKSGFAEESVTLAGGDCGSDKDCDKDGAQSAKSGDAVRVAGGGCGSDKDCDGDKSGKSSLGGDSVRVAGGDCGSDKDCDKDGKGSANRSATVFTA